jgi:hypothetical protein
MKFTPEGAKHITDLSLYNLKDIPVGKANDFLKANTKSLKVISELLPDAFLNKLERTDKGGYFVEIDTKIQPRKGATAQLLESAIERDPVNNPTVSFSISEPPTVVLSHHIPGADLVYGEHHLKPLEEHVKAVEELLPQIEETNQYFSEFQDILEKQSVEIPE